MCALSSIYNHSFKWVTCLVVITGVYTFLHWFLAVPLLYSHLYECCNQKWSRNWIVWFLAISFACWLGVSIFIASVWYCWSLCKVRHLNDSNVRLTEKTTANADGEKPEKAKTVYFDKDAVDILVKSSEGIKENDKEVVSLPDFSPEENLTVLKVTERQTNESPVGKLDFGIPVDESLHYVQKESPQTESNETPLKTPREIFFKDLIEAASKSASYFDFDPEKVSRELKKKYESEKLKEEEENYEEGEDTEKSFFVGSRTEKERLTSEVVITLDEKGAVVEPPIGVGQFQILKE